MASVKTTPLTIIGVAGEARSCETQPVSSESAPPASITFSATTAPAETGPLVSLLPADRRPLAGTRIHDVPAPDCCHAARASPLTEAPAPSNAFDAASGVA